ncbi:MAG: hypothetical protein HRT88_11780, partial [Lentisphaeraceae bacterium]|nr:hypothetical protein [Lentisphaeraceae bacterium]
KLRDSLRQEKFTVASPIGSSHFTCPLAVSTDEHPHTLELALLDASGDQPNAALEMAFIRPRLLESFNWKCLNMSSKDYLERHEDLLQEIKGE